MTLALRSLLVTLAIQAFVSLAAFAVPVLAPVIAPEVGVPTAALGVFVGALYAASMFASLASGAWIDRHGPIRVSQWSALLAMLGLAAATGPLAMLALASVLIGVGYGPVTPASSHILIRTAPPGRVAITFSLKQTGVPLGAAVAGALLPTLAQTIGWRVSLWLTAAIGVLIAFAAQPIRDSLDVDLRGGRRATLTEVLAPLHAFLADRGLRELGRTGAVYAFTQTTLISFLVAFLSSEAGLSLIAAGLALTVLNAFAVAGRVGWGAAADRWIAPRRLLGWLGMVSGGCGLLMAGVGPEWPRALLLLLCALYGSVAIGWNGVHLSEIARAAPSGRAGAITGASSFITFSGILVGPPLMGAIAGSTGSYRPGFIVLGVASLANGLALWWKHR